MVVRPWEIMSDYIIIRSLLCRLLLLTTQLPRVVKTAAPIKPRGNVLDCFLPTRDPQTCQPDSHARPARAAAGPAQLGASAPGVLRGWGSLLGGGISDATQGSFPIDNDKGGSRLSMRRRPSLCVQNPEF